jgi:hypothetical protein
MGPRLGSRGKAVSPGRVIPRVYAVRRCGCVHLRGRSTRHVRSRPSTGTAINPHPPSYRAASFDSATSSAVASRNNRPVPSSRNSYLIFAIVLSSLVTSPAASAALTADTRQRIDLRHDSRRPTVFHRQPAFLHQPRCRPARSDSIRLRAVRPAPSTASDGSSLFQGVEQSGIRKILRKARTSPDQTDQPGPDRPARTRPDKTEEQKAAETT